MPKSKIKGAAGTFMLNKGEPIHRWYSYLEGYSSCLIDALIQEVGAENINTIYDPFCGTGTTALVASKYGIMSYYSETNPFMQKVIEAKINRVKSLRDSGIGSKYLRLLLDRLESYTPQLTIDEPEWDGFEKFFDAEVLSNIKELSSIVMDIEDDDTKEIALVLLASVIVRSSKMVRQGDLRFAKESEKSDDDRDVLQNFISKVEDAIEDIENDQCCIAAGTKCLNADSREIEGDDFIDCVITSPPYLNGTNYIRNTKLELKLSGFIKSEKDLPLFHSRGIIAGINNVSKRKSVLSPHKCVLPYIKELEPVSYDKRIQLMIAGYFNDMEMVIKKLARVIRHGGYFIMDIGDSQFAGVHIPTHEILIKICEENGFKLYAEEVLRERRSKNGMVLSQRLLKFRLYKGETEEEAFKKAAKQFMESMPYHNPPFSGRNWGHSWHSLCSYHGKLKPAIAHFMVSKFTKPGDVILDPLCGVGTIPLEACLQGRIGIGNDLSELAYVVSKAKLEKPEQTDCLSVLKELNDYIENTKNSLAIDNQIEQYTDFGFNGKLSSYFHPDTYRELLSARSYFVPRIKNLSSAEAMVFSCLLHVLHGNRPYALSRQSHPLTPYAPKGEFVYKSVIQHIEDKLTLSYKRGEFEQYCFGRSIFGDYNDLSEKGLQVDAVICSPPFADSIRFYMQNWMRLWLCGWEPDDYKNADAVFLDQKQKKDFDIYKSFFEMCHKVLKKNGKVILHLGKTDKIDMAHELALRADTLFDVVYSADEDVQEVEKHGIKDKGATIAHQFLFLQKK